MVLVTSVDADGNVDIAPKNWVSMAAFVGPIVGFGCNREHDTYRNVVATGEFVINVPDALLTELIWAMPATHGRKRIDDAGLTVVDSECIDPPSIAECCAHLECRRHSITEFDGSEVFVFGTILAGRLDTRCMNQERAVAYHRLDPIFLENGCYAPMGGVAAPVSGR